MAKVKDVEFLKYIISNLVDNPDKIKIERKVDERGVLLTLTVDPEDMGKVIGRKGNTAQAVRKLLAVFGAQNDERISLQIAEPEGGTGGASREARKDAIEEEIKTVEEIADEDEGEEKPTSVL